MNELSKCCNAPIKAHYAYEGTGCYVCEKCGKACDPAIPHTKGTPEAQKPRIEKLDYDLGTQELFGIVDGICRSSTDLDKKTEMLNSKINELITELQCLSDEVRELRETV